MATSTSWLYRLGQQTAAYHAVADAQRLAVMDVTSASQLRAFLGRVYGFEAPIQRRAARMPALEPAAAGLTTRIGRLHQDLLALSLDELDVAALPTVTVEALSNAEALGWLLVIERHVLLAGLIRRCLASALPQVFTTARSYFDTHVDGGTRYRELGDVMRDAITCGDIRPDAVLQGARHAFELQHQWYARTARRSHPQRHTIASPATQRPKPTHPRNAA